MKKILIIKPSGIGDIIHSLPVAMSLKKVFPDNIIHWLVFSKFEVILKNVDYIDKIISWDRDGGIKEFFRIVSIVRKENYDISIDLQGLLRSAILNRLSGAREKVASPLLREFSWMIEKPVVLYNSKQHAVDRNYEVAKYLCKNKQLAQPMDMLPWLKTTEEGRNKATELINKTDNIVLFNVSSRGKHKIWPAKKYSQLINMLCEKFKILPLFIGTSDEEKIVQNVVKDVLYENINLVGKTDLNITIAIIEQCKMVIGNDSGIIHIAAALNKPVLAIFGATNPQWYYPYNKISKYIYKYYKCSPCDIKAKCKNYKCMDNIEVEEVFEFIKDNFFR